MMCWAPSGKSLSHFTRVVESTPLPLEQSPQRESRHCRETDKQKELPHLPLPSYSLNMLCTMSALYTFNLLCKCMRYEFLVPC